MKRKLRHIAERLIPDPLVEKIKEARKLSRRKSGILFEGRDEIFKEAARTSKAYVEYGCGESTIWMDRNCEARIFSVDTSLDWVESITAELKSEAHRIRWVDCGPVGDWGKPETSNKKDNFLAYATMPWEVQPESDLVLIDGRFRVLCFMACYLHGPAKARIIFDDYTQRKRYHIVEELLPAKERNTRQAMFMLPEKDARDYDMADRIIEEYRYYID